MRFPTRRGRWIELSAERSINHLHFRRLGGRTVAGRVCSNLIREASHDRLHHPKDDGGEGDEGAEPEGVELDGVSAVAPHRAPVLRRVDELVGQLHHLVVVVVDIAQVRAADAVAVALSLPHALSMQEHFRGEMARRKEVVKRAEGVFEDLAGYREGNRRFDGSLFPAAVVIRGIVVVLGYREESDRINQPSSVHEQID